MAVKASWYVDAALERATAAGGAGVLMAAESIRTVALSRTPKREGDLRDSAHVHIERDTASVYYDAPYAVRQHEELAYHHTEGQAKYLESAVQDTQDQVLQILATELRKGIGG